MEEYAIGLLPAKKGKEWMEILENSAKEAGLKYDTKLYGKCYKFSAKQNSVISNVEIRLDGQKYYNTLVFAINGFAQPCEETVNILRKTLYKKIGL